MDKEYTAFRIEYCSGLTGTDGVTFTLKPEKGHHNQEYVAKAKSELKRNRDGVVTIKVERQLLDDNDTHRGAATLPWEIYKRCMIDLHEALEDGFEFSELDELIYPGNSYTIDNRMQTGLRGISFYIKVCRSKGMSDQVIEESILVHKEPEPTIADNCHKLPRLKLIEIWMAVFGIGEQVAKAQRIGQYFAMDFDDAIAQYQKVDPEAVISLNTMNQYSSKQAYFNRESSFNIAGCNLYDNEGDAKKNLG